MNTRINRRSYVSYFILSKFLVRTNNDSLFFKDLHMICNLLEGARTIDKFVVFDDFGINLGSDKSYNLQRYTKLYDVLYPK